MKGKRHKEVELFDVFFMKKKDLLCLICCLSVLPACSTTYYIKQTLKDGAIACKGKSCDAYPVSTTCTGTSSGVRFGMMRFGGGSSNCYTEMKQPLMVFIDNIDGVEYYDGMIVELNKGVKDVQQGVYKYTPLNGEERTLPHIVFLDKKKK